MPLTILEAKYIPGSKVVYIGKAGSPKGKATLRGRIRQYLSFGRGKKIGHWGGRLIWQLKHHPDLLICWKPIPNSDPRGEEKSLLERFESEWGRLPFANLSR